MKTNITTKPYFECGRCNLNSLKDKWCPCPRGSCEARKVGEIKTKVIIERTINANKNKKT